ELRRELVRLMRRFRPTRLVCQTPERSWKPQLSIGAYHPDHLAAGQATLAAVYPASQNPWDFPELLDEGLMPHKVREILITGTPEPNYAIDVSDTIDIKIAALRAHDSQLGARFAQVEEFVRKRLADNGAAHGVTYAEIRSEEHTSELQSRENLV